MSATITTTPGDFLELVAVIAAMTPSILARRSASAWCAWGAKRARAE